MSLKLTLIRKGKANFIRFRLHKIIEPFTGLMLNLSFLSKISKFISKNRNLKFNDFYSGKWDYNKRYKLYEFILNEKNLQHEKMTYLEFGVYGGYSFEWWVKNNDHPSSSFIGFDTFEGLPEDWGIFKKGDMSAGLKLPAIEDPRVTFAKGLFQDTLPGILKTLDKGKKKVILMDADLYTSTLYALTSLAPYLAKGDIILFDQFNVPRHEFLAFTNFTESYYMKFELIGAANNYYFCAFEKV
ncbi:MAG: class I SAM-dependent methyltransferase [Bacteroidetes bacterium]|nr:class I SAM-dependent methyltransferase [Bacteroidota bacterium]